MEFSRISSNYVLMSRLFGDVNATKGYAEVWQDSISVLMNILLKGLEEVDKNSYVADILIAELI